MSDTADEIDRLRDLLLEEVKRADAAEAQVESLREERDRYKQEAESRAKWTARTMPIVRESRERRKIRIRRLERTVKRVKAASRRDQEALQFELATALDANRSLEYRVSFLDNMYLEEREASAERDRLLAGIGALVEKWRIDGPMREAGRWSCADELESLVADTNQETAAT